MNKTNIELLAQHSNDNIEISEVLKRCIIDLQSLTENSRSGLIAMLIQDLSIALTYSPLVDFIALNEAETLKND